MTRSIQLDLIGGIAGDMFAAAVFDAWPEHIDGAIDAARQAGLPESWEARVEKTINAGIAGTHVDIVPPQDEKVRRSTPTGTLKTIRDMLRNSGLAQAVSKRAVDIFEILGEAEAEVHGCAVDDVHFHEIADWDSVADIVMAAYLIEHLGAESWTFSSIPTGRGSVQTEHGPMPVPAPATTALLRGFQTHDDGREGERVTPTGAAIIKYLGGDQSPRPAGTVGRIGTGLGTKIFPGLSNCLRLMEITASHAAEAGDVIGVIEFEVDDQTPEDLSVGLDIVRASDAVVDVFQTQGFGKKGRAVVSVRVLCHADRIEQVAALCFEQCATIGLRYRSDRRLTLQRRETVIDGIRVKISERPGGYRTAKAEMDDIAEAAGTRADRDALRRRIEAKAIEDPGD